MKPTIVPFVKWVGGKRQLQKKLKNYLPKTYKTYYEPFVGGGAFLFYLQPKKAVINDLNSELINAYKVIKSKYNVLREYLLLMEYGHRDSFYTKIRSIDRNPVDDERTLNMEDSKELRAARFIYLNKAGFNGLYRVNKLGLFNVPSGKKEKVKTHEYPNIKNVHSYLKNIEIKNVSFEKAVAKAEKNDFIYFDPPYDYEDRTKGFDAYQKSGFGSEGTKKLARLCKSLHKKGVKWMVSNHNTQLVRELFSDFNINVVKAKRMVGGKGASRNDVEEVIVTNYKVNNG